MASGSLITALIVILTLITLGMVAWRFRRWEPPATARRWLIRTLLAIIAVIWLVWGARACGFTGAALLPVLR